MVPGLTCLWDSGANRSMINRKHTKNCESKMWYNKVEYSTVDGVYCMTHDVKVPFNMLVFSSSTIIYRLHVDNNKGDSLICYEKIIVRNLMLQLGPIADFKIQVIQ